MATSAERFSGGDAPDPDDGNNGNNSNSNAEVDRLETIIWKLTQANKFEITDTDERGYQLVGTLIPLSDSRNYTYGKYAVIKVTQDSPDEFPYIAIYDWDYKNGRTRRDDLSLGRQIGGAGFDHNIKDENVVIKDLLDSINAGVSYDEVKNFQKK